MTEQPKALRLAEIIGGDCAAELRRLHEEVTEQGRLLSMSAERELSLLTRIGRLEKLNAELLNAHFHFRKIKREQDAAIAKAGEQA